MGSAWTYIRTHDRKRDGGTTKVWNITRVLGWENEKLVWVGNRPLVGLRDFAHTPAHAPSPLLASVQPTRSAKTRVELKVRSTRTRDAPLPGMHLKLPAADLPKMSVWCRSEPFSAELLDLTPWVIAPEKVRHTSKQQESIFRPAPRKA
jgi:hypothetical protein